MSYSVRWNQLKGHPLAIGDIVQWMGVTFRVEAIEPQPETKSDFTKYGGGMHHYDNAKLTVSYIEGEILDWMETALSEGGIAVGPT